MRSLVQADVSAVELADEPFRNVLKRDFQKRSTLSERHNAGIQGRCAVLLSERSHYQCMPNFLARSIHRPASQSRGGSMFGQLDCEKLKCIDRGSFQPCSSSEVIPRGRTERRMRLRM